MAKKTASEVSEQIRKDITDKIVDALKNGKVPWRRPWSDDPNCGFPINIVSKKAYSGINPFVLEIAALEKGYKSKWWATYNQWLGIKGQVRKGEKGTYVVFYKVLEYDDPKHPKKDGSPGTRKVFFLRTYKVFNLDQVEGEALNKYRGVAEAQDPPISAKDHTLFDFSGAETLIQATGAKITIGGNHARYYRPTPKDSWPKHTGGDFIQMPKKSQFADPSEFYVTHFHELAHWSEVRLDWEDKYAMCELVAEITACYLAAEMKIPNRNMENHERYIHNWLEKMESDPKWIFHASTQASKATDYLLSFVNGKQKQTTSEAAEHEPTEAEEIAEQAA